MKENVTLSDLKAGDKLICTNLEYIQRFKVGKEYEVKEGEFGLFIENEHKVPIYIELNIKAFSECFSLLTPQQPERLLSEADNTEYIGKVDINDYEKFLGSEVLKIFVEDKNEEVVYVRKDKAIAILQRWIDEKHKPVVDALKQENKEAAGLLSKVVGCFALERVEKFELNDKIKTFLNK